MKTSMNSEFSHWNHHENQKDGTRIIKYVNFLLKLILKNKFTKTSKQICNHMKFQ